MCWGDIIIFECHTTCMHYYKSDMMKKTFPQLNFLMDWIFLMKFVVIFVFLLWYLVTSMGKSMQLYLCCNKSSEGINWVYPYKHPIWNCRKICNENVCSAHLVFTEQFLTKERHCNHLISTWNCIIEKVWSGDDDWNLPSLRIVIENWFQCTLNQTVCH